MHDSNSAGPPGSHSSATSGPSARIAVGILAYGSLIDDPGPEISPYIEDTIRDVETPFRVEYARSSSTRGGAPTLVPTEAGGSQVKAVILVLRDSIPVNLAMDWLWRREVRRYGRNDHYHAKLNPGRNDVVINSLTDFGGVQTVLYTRIAANISPLIGEELAKRAIESAKAEVARIHKDGISYLIDAKRHGIITPLTASYDEAILRLTDSPDLVTAFRNASGIGVPPDAEQLKSIVLSFCQECVWTWSIRAHFSQLYESGEKRHQLLAEIARTFFHDMNLTLLEYVLLQQAKLTDPASSGVGKENLTTNYIVGLPWKAEIQKRLSQENDELMKFRQKINDARRLLVAHTDLHTRIDEMVLGSFTRADESDFWGALQRFVNTAHEEAVGGPFEIEASMPDGDAASLIHRLADAIDYDDLLREDAGVLKARAGKRRYGDA
jgi:hypothetical protein